MRYPSQDQIAWQFDTARFRIVFHTEPEDMDPADSFQFQEDIDAVRSGAVEWFRAVVSVWYGADTDNLIYITADALGGCAYNSVREFMTAHRDADPMNRNSSVMRAARGNISICHYFPDMVSTACQEARRIMSGCVWQNPPKMRAA